MTEAVDDRKCGTRVSLSMSLEDSDPGRTGTTRRRTEIRDLPEVCSESSQIQIQFQVLFETQFFLRHVPVQE